MNFAEAAAWLNVPEKSLRAKVAARAVPHTRVGRHVRFAQHHLDAIVAAGETPVAKAPPALTATRLRTGRAA
jgi:excisionase family DNA binding protein